MISYIILYKMLSNIDIDNLIEKMNIPNFKGCFYKDK